MHANHQHAQTPAVPTTIPDLTLGYPILDVARLMGTSFEARTRSIGVTRAQWSLIGALVRAAGCNKGFFYGLMFLPLTTPTFATLARHLRTDGAALIQLPRQLAGGIGIAACFGGLVRWGHGYSQALAGRLNLDADAWWSGLGDRGATTTALPLLAPVLLMQRGGPDTVNQNDIEPSKVDAGAG